MEKRTLKLWVKIFLIFIIVFCFITSVFLTYLYIDYNKNKDEQLLYSYNINQLVDYTVNLYDNSFIDAEAIGPNELYISELVKDININYTFDYSATKNANLTFKYKVIGNLNGIYQGSSSNTEQGSVWSKEYKLSEEIEKNIDAKNYFIDRNIVVDFPSYKKEVEAFRKKFGMSLSTNMNIDFIVNISGIVNEKEFETEKIIKLSFPLGVQAFSINEDYQKNISENVLTKTDIKKFPLANIPTIIALLLTAFLVFALSYKKIFNFSEKTEYNKRLEKILKTYDDVIIEITSPVNIDDYEIIEVKGIDEMVDLEEELRIPINFYEHIPNYYGEFTLIHNNIVYRYIIEQKKEDK